MPQVRRDDGAELTYRLRGDRGPAVLFIQGVGAGGVVWSPQTSELARSHRTIEFDNRGLGESSAPAGSLSIEQMAEDAAAIARHAGWDSCHIVGHSMGGVIAQRLALSHPPLVRSLSLMCTVSRGRDAVRLNLRNLIAGVRMNVGPRSLRRRAFLELIYPRDFLAGRDARGLADELRAVFGRDLADPPPITTRQAMALRRHDCTAELAKLAGLPTLVVSAEHDPIAPPSLGRALAVSITGARFVEFRGASHGVTIQLAREVNDLLASFIANAELTAGRATESS